MKNSKCSVHGTELVEKEVSIFYGMPTPDSDIFEIGDRFPHHGLYQAVTMHCVGDGLQAKPECPRTTTGSSRITSFRKSYQRGSGHPLAGCLSLAELNAVSKVDCSA